MAARLGLAFRDVTEYRKGVVGEGKRGRPPRGDVALTGAERSRAYRERRRALAEVVPFEVQQLANLFVGFYVDHRRRDHVRSVLLTLPLPVRAYVAGVARDFVHGNPRLVLWEAYQAWHAREPERWPIPPARIP